MRLTKQIWSAVIDVLVYALLGGVVAARMKGVKVGQSCRIYFVRFGSEPFLVTIGDDVTISSGVRFITHDGSTGLVRDNQGHRYQRFAPIVIGSNVFVGSDSILLPGVTIGSNVVIGAGSVLTRDVPDNSIVAGNPARFLKTFTEYCKQVEETCVNDSELSSIKSYKARVQMAIEIAAKSRSHSDEM